MLPAVAVKPRQKQIHTHIAEDGRGKTDNRQPSRPAPGPAAGDAAVKERGIDEPDGPLPE